MEASPAESSAAEANRTNKRKRVSRACDACFSKKDRCDGVQPICKVCKNLGRPCTYNRPERKRGPSQGVRQRLEGQIDSLESVLGYMVDTYPQICCEAIKHLRLDEVEESMGNSARLFGNAFNTPSPSSPQQSNAGNIYPHYSKADARELWRLSTFAKAIAPSLTLSLGADDEDDEMTGVDSWRGRIEDARRARARLASGITSNSPVFASMHAPQQHQPQHSHLSHHMPSHFPQPTSHPSAHLQPYGVPQHAAAGNAAQFQQPMHPYSPKKPQPSRHPTHFAPSPQPPPLLGPDPGHHQPPHYQPHHQYGQQQRSLGSPYHSTGPVQAPMETYGPPTSTFEGETDALAYALGLTSYTASPQTDHLGPRSAGFAGPSASQPQHWMPTSSGASEQPGNPPFHPMQGLDQQQSSSSQEDNEPTGLTYFSDLDLSLGTPTSNTNHLSILHQLGLQGSLDMPTPVATGPDHGDSGAAAATPGTSGSSNNHHTPHQWLHSIRSMN